MKLNLDLSGVKIQTSSSNYTTVPAGEYDVVVSKAELKSVKNNGQMLILGYEVQNGEFAGKLIKDTFLVVHEDPKTLQIARARLKTVAFATGHKNPESIVDSDDLFNLKPFSVTVDVVERDQYKNNVVKYITKLTIEPDTSFEAPKASTTVKKPWAK